MFESYGSIDCWRSFTLFDSTGLRASRGPNVMSDEESAWEEGSEAAEEESDEGVVVQGGGGKEEGGAGV